MIGTQIKGYKFIDEIGQGGFSEIYKVQKDEEIYAMKIVEKEMIIDQQLEKYIKNEVEVLRAIKSQHVIQLYDFFEDQDYYYFVIECCDINTLLEYIIEQKPDKEICIQILIQILKGMKDIHKNKCLHRDLKLENILIKNGIFKIADFGLSAQSDEGESYIGTLKYMAPEVLNENQGHTYKADFWSVGIIFFFMIYKCFPFTNRKKLYKEQKQKCTPEFDLEKVLNECLKEKQSTKQVVNIDQNLKELFKNFFVFNPQNRCPIKTFFNLKIFQNYLSKEEVNEFVETYLVLDQKFDNDIGATIYGGRQMSLINIQSQNTLNDNIQQIKSKTEVYNNKQNKNDCEIKNKIPKIKKKVIDMNGRIKNDSNPQQFQVQIPLSNIQNILSQSPLGNQAEKSVKLLLKNHQDQLYSDDSNVTKQQKQNQNNSTSYDQDTDQDSFYQLYGTTQEPNCQFNKTINNNSNNTNNYILTNKENIKSVSKTQQEIVEIEENLNNNNSYEYAFKESQQNAFSKQQFTTFSKCQKTNIDQEENLQSDEEYDEITPSSLQLNIQQLVAKLTTLNKKIYKFGPFYQGEQNSYDLFKNIMQGDMGSSLSGITKTHKTSKTSNQNNTQKSDMKTVQSIKSTIFKQNVREGILYDIFSSEFEDIQDTYSFQINKYLFLQDSLSVINKIQVTPDTFSVLVLLIGFVFIMSSYIAMLFYDFTCKGEIPNWLFIKAGIEVIIYQTLDAVDGKQARRTKSSSPLGQLFDHGCDSFAITFILLTLSQSCQLEKHIVCLGFISNQLMMFQSNWIEYHTHILNTQYGNFGVTEVELIAASQLLYAGIFGQKSLQKSMYDILPQFISSQFEFIESENLQWALNLKLGQAAATMIIIISFIIAVITFVKTIISIERSKKLYAISQYIPYLSMCAIVLVWYRSPIFEEYAGFILCSFGILFSTMTCKLIISSLTRMKYKIFHTPIIVSGIVSIVVLLIQNIVSKDILFLVFILLTIYIVIYAFVFVSTVINQITKHLGIYCFSLKKRPKKLD